MFKYEFSRKTKNLFRIIGFLLFAALIIYLNGMVTQMVMKFFLHLNINPTFNPIIAFRCAFTFKYSLYVWIAFIVLAIIIAAYAFSMSDKRGKMDSGMTADKDKKFEYSGKENYGSARLMTEPEIKDEFCVVPSTSKGIDKTNGSVLFGFLNEKKKEIVAMPESDWKKGTDYNKNIAVCGPPGSNKTRGFVMNFLLQKILVGESIIVVDTKGELYAKTYPFAKDHGYEGKILNLIEQDRSDGWDILDEVKNSPESATELAATVIRNTGGKAGKDFWDIAEENILKAVILLKSVGQADISNITGKKQNMGDVYKYIATRKVFIKDGGGESMEADFQFLQQYIPDHPAITPFLQFTNAGPDLCKQIIHGLANRLQLFQNPQLSKVLGTKDIDLEAAGKRKCIYYLRFSDQTSTYSFITALFFSFLAVKLVGYADSREDRKLPVPVNLVLDEFCNIGAIPDFERKMATFRSRLINVVLIFQNIMLFDTTYPNGLWEAILATCDTFVVLGVGNEMTTAEFVSKMTGEATTSVGSSSYTLDTHQMRTTASTGKRYVKNPDEIRRLDKMNRKALVFVTGRQVMEVFKMDYSENPIYLANKAVIDNEISVLDHETKVEKVDIRYEDYIIDGVMRDSYKQSMTQDDKGNDDNDKGKKKDDNDRSKYNQDDDNSSERNYRKNNRHNRGNNTIHGNHGNSQIPPGI